MAACLSSWCAYLSWCAGALTSPGAHTAFTLLLVHSGAKQSHTGALVCTLAMHTSNVGVLSHWYSIGALGAVGPLLVHIGNVHQWMGQLVDWTLNTRFGFTRQRGNSLCPFYL